MTDFSYVPDSGGWLFIVDAGLVLGVAAVPEPPRLEALRRALRDADSTDVVLDELTRDGISATPPFVLLDARRSGELGALARGPVEVRVRRSGAELTVSGHGLSGWAEERVSDVTGFVCTVGATTGPRLLLASGAVLAGSIEAGTPDTAPSRSAVERAAPIVHRVRPEGLPMSEATISAPAEQIDALVEREAAPSESAGGYDHLFGETVVRSVEQAAVRDPSSAEDEAPLLEEHTVVAADLGKLRAQRRAARRAEPEPPPASRLFVELSTGGRESLDQPLVVGRAPSASSVGGEAVPRLVTMDTPNQDISRTHVQIVHRDGTVVVTDLHSKNGTTILAPGKAPQRLREGEPTVVIVGTVIDLGDGATLTVREG